MQLLSGLVIRRCWYFFRASSSLTCSCDLYFEGHECNQFPVKEDRTPNAPIPHLLYHIIPSPRKCKNWCLQERGVLDSYFFHKVLVPCHLTIGTTKLACQEKVPSSCASCGYTVFFSAWASDVFPDTPSSRHCCLAHVAHSSLDTSLTADAVMCRTIVKFYHFQ